MAKRIGSYKYSISDAFKERFYIVPDYRIRGCLADRSGGGVNRFSLPSL